MRLAVLVTVFTLGGCYYYYPKLPKHPAPELVDGARVEVETESHDYLRTCDPERERDCHHTGRAWKKESTYRTATIKYDGRALTQWEARQLVDPDFGRKIQRIKDKKGLCNLSKVPTYIAMAGATALVLVAPFQDNLGVHAKPVGFGIAAATAGSALASMPLGGFACAGARDEYRRLWHSVDPSATTFRVRRNVSGKDSSNYLDEMEELARRFNARVRTDVDARR